MAQETAGTIGIPVLKNEILPYMEYYARRREKAAALEAARQNKLAELEYKRQAEAEKIAVPSLPTPKGGYFTKIIDRDRQSLSRGLVEAQQKGMGKGDLVTAANVGIQGIGSKDALNEFYTRQLDEEATALSKMGYNVTPGLIQQYVDEEDARDPANFMTKFSVENFGQFVRNNTGLYNLPQVATNIITSGKITPNKIKINTARGGQDYEYYPFFDIGQQQVNGKNVVGPTAVNIESAEELYNSNPQTREFKDTWIAREAERRTRLDPVISKIVDPTEKQNQAVESAARDFYERSLGHLKQIKYGEIPGRAGRQGAVQYKNVGASQSSLQLVAPSTTSKGVRISTTSISPAKPTDLVFQVPANTNVFKANDFSSYPLPTGSLNLTDLNLGYAARNKKTGEYIKPDDWKNTLVSDVEFVEGSYATPETYQTKPLQSGGQSFTQAIGSLFVKPTTIGERVFLPKGTVGSIESQARNILQKKGLNYNSIMKQNLAQTRKLFKQTKFKTRH
jgi:hypothetical protein